MVSFVFIFWCIGIIVSLSAFFMQPKYIFKRLNEYHFPNYSRDLTKTDNEFIDRHLHLVEKHQLILSKQKRPFILGAKSYVFLFFIMMAVFLMLFISSSRLNNWLTDLTTNEIYFSSFLVDPYPSNLTFVTAIFLGLLIWNPILQILINNKNEKTLTYNLLMPNYETKVGTEEFSYKLEEIRTRITKTLSILIRENALDSRDNYSLDEILKSLIRDQAKHVKRLGFASLAFFFLVYIMDAFNFTKITNNAIIYSPSFSFKVTAKSFADVTSAKYSCVKEDTDRHLKLLVELDNGYQFRVRKYRIEKMKAVLDAADISLRNIDEADEWCKNLKF